MKYILFYILILLIGSTCSNHKEDYLLDIDTDRNNTTGQTALSSIFTYHNLIKLDSNLRLGNIVKIVKKNETIYILNNYKSIFIYNKAGQALSKIDNEGNGPKEYSQILDFDVKGDVIYILSYKKIYLYNIKGEYVNHFSLSFVANKLICTSKGILYQTSRNHKVLTYTDYKGNIISEFLETDLTNRLSRNVQFTEISNQLVVYQMAYTNDIVILNCENGNFRVQKLTNIPGSLQHSKYEALLTVFGDAADNHLSSNICYDGLSYYKDHILFPYLDKKQVYFCVYDMVSDNYTNLLISSDTKIINDITFTDLKFFQTISNTQSDDCVLVYIYPYKIKEKINNFIKDNPAYNTNVYLKYVKSIVDSSSDEDNPILIELRT